jgi:hypothetical protein
VRDDGMMMELQCGDLEERYRTRLLYAVGWDWKEDVGVAQPR